MVKPKLVAAVAAAALAGFVLGGAMQWTGIFPLVGKDGASVGYALGRRTPDAPARDVEVRIEGSDVILLLGDPLEVRVRGGRRAARKNLAPQAAPQAEVFSYLEIAVLPDWAFVFGHAIRTLQRGQRYEVNGELVERPAHPTGPMKIGLDPL